MKTMNFYFVMALLAFSTVSCVENSGKYKALVAQRDSLQMNNMMLEKNNDEIIEILNEAEVIFQDIRTAENKVVMNMNGSDRETRSKKDQITRDM